MMDMFFRIAVKLYFFVNTRHVGASCISLAPTFFKSQSALIALLLLSKSNPLRWASIWFWAQSRKKIDFNPLLHNRTLILIQWVSELGCGYFSKGLVVQEFSIFVKAKSRPGSCSWPALWFDGYSSPREIVALWGNRSVLLCWAIGKWMAVKR